ncbi:Harbinger transposase-derived nuclease domain [Phytophthora cactorum]|nr:Harbinger transposase-derived nuclease domain [Phytophthora cactorum]
MGEVMTSFAAVKGFPFACGAIDGSRFEIKRPAEYEGWYCKDYYPAINMQAVCDSKRRFMDYEMCPGSYSDKKTWSISKLGLSAANVLPGSSISCSSSTVDAVVCVSGILVGREKGPTRMLSCETWPSILRDRKEAVVTKIGLFDKLAVRLTWCGAT